MLEDLILNEMPDVGLARLKAYEQRNLPFDEQDDDLDEKAEHDLTAYVRFFPPNQPRKPPPFSFRNFPSS